MYTCDYLRLIEIFWITSLPFLVCVMCSFILWWSYYTREKVILQMVLWKMLLNEPIAVLKAFWKTLILFICIYV